MTAGFKERLKIVADAVGGTAELARLSDSKRRTLDDYLAGKTKPNYERAARLADAGGYRVEWLLKGVGPPQDKPLGPGEPPAAYLVSATEANQVVAALKREIGYAGGDWDGLLVALMAEHGLRPSGVREVLKHLMAFQVPATGSQA